MKIKCDICKKKYENENNNLFIGSLQNIEGDEVKVYICNKCLDMEPYNDVKVNCYVCNVEFTLGFGDDPFCDNCSKGGVVKDHPYNWQNATKKCECGNDMHNSVETIMCFSCWKKKKDY